MQRSRFTSLSAAAVLGFVSQTAFGHNPIMSDGTAVDAASAIALDDVQVSRVVYHEVTESAQRLWLTFEVAEPQSLLINLGVPYIDRLVDFRPAFVLLGPGLPAVELLFDTPPELGGLVVTTDSVTEPEEFYEPFSRTRSWILYEDVVELPAAGRYYIVAYVPSGELGKLWIATGVREEFSLADLLGLGRVLRQVREFHEVRRRFGLFCSLFTAGS